jgi:zinc protease
MKSNEPPIVSYKLTNGLEVYLIEKKAIPMATVLIAVRNGSFIETEQNNGLAHLYEHMFFKANDKMPSQPQFMHALDEMGIELGPNMNAYTSTESVRYFFTIHTQYLERGLGFMADALITPKFLQE